jgi:hypothetical protein
MQECIQYKKYSDMYLHFIWLFLKQYNIVVFIFLLLIEFSLELIVT